MKLPVPLLATAALLPAAHAGSFSPAAGQAGSDAIEASYAGLLLWADAAVVTRGPIDITLPGGALASFGSDADATGPADATIGDTFPVVSLGDGGTATLTFAKPLSDGPGPDLAVFENSLNDNFLELAFVEVSSDGVHFARFPATSLTPTDVHDGSFAGIDPTDVHNLAGKYRAGFGTPFDFAEITDPLVNTAAITHVRVVDAVGTIDPVYATTDASGNIVKDPYPTNFYSGGFDLDAVGALHPAPGPWANWTWGYFGTLSTPFAGDSDGDGLSEGLEWALWCDPHRASAPLKLAAAPNGFALRFPFHSSRSPAVLRIEATDNPGDSWTTIAALGPTGWSSSETGIAVSTDGGFPATITVESSSAPFRYFRCYIEQ